MRSFKNTAAAAAASLHYYPVVVRTTAKLEGKYTQHTQIGIIAQSEKAQEGSWEQLARTLINCMYFLLFFYTPFVPPLYT